MTELKMPTSETIRVVAKDFPQLNAALRKLFPDAFEEELKEKWEDITTQVHWKLDKHCDYFHLEGTFGDEENVICDLDANGIHQWSGKFDFKIETSHKISEMGTGNGYGFRVLKLNEGEEING